MLKGLKVTFAGKTESGEDKYTAYVPSPEINEKDGSVIVGVATDTTEDRDGDIVDPRGVELKNFLKNPIMLFGHNHQMLPIGVAENVRLEGKKILFNPRFTSATQLGRDVQALVDDKVLRAFSIGFIPKERNGNVFTKAELLEISIVNVPSNPEALILAKSKGLNTSILEKKEVPGVRELALFPDTKEWDPQGAVKRLREWAGGDDKETINWDKYKQAFAYRDESDAKNFSSYKLPIADVEGEEIKAVWRGVATAQAALLGARAGLDLPDEERRQIHSFLGKYYEKFGRKQPEFRMYDSQDEVVKAFQEGSLLSDEAMGLIVALHSAPVAEEKQEVAEESVDDELNKQLLDAAHLLFQKFSAETNQFLNKINVARKHRNA